MNEYIFIYICALIILTKLSHTHAIGAKIRFLYVYIDKNAS